MLSINKLSKENRLQGAFMIKEERDAQPDENSAKKTKEDNAWDQRVLEAQRAEENEESVVEMVRRLDQ